jgi:lysophospholipase L1-like esterase
MVKILIIGDSISIGYYPWVKEMLSGRAIVAHNEGNARHTGYALDKIRKWTGADDYDIILFNWGLHDLCYRHPDAQVYGNRDKIRGQLKHTPDEYRANLDSLVRTMKATTDAELIFVTTSYVPENEAGRYTEDPPRYNAVAREIMQKNSVAVIDIYENSRIIHTQHGLRSDDVHYTQEGYRELASLIVAFIEKEMEQNHKSP